MYIKTKFGEFEWDERKAAINLEEHNLAFEEAIWVFNGKTFTYESVGEGRDYGETREVSIGWLKGVLIVAVVHTQRGQIKRLISARPAKRKERARFAAFIERGDQTP